jgi:nucleoside-diphosphate-sugar epimerase
MINIHSSFSGGGDHLRVLITGASGFLGGHIVDAVKTAGHETIVLARPSSDLSRVRTNIEEIRYGCLEDIDSLREAMKGVEAVFHCAGAVRHVVPYKELLQTNVIGTRHVTRAAGENGVGKIIYASSMGTMGLDQGDNYRKRPKDKYCRSKAQAEAAFFEECDRHGIQGIALRPGVIYGPRDYTAAYHWFGMADRGQIFLFGDGSARFPLVYIEDLTKVFIEALEREDLVGQAIPIQGEEEATLEKVMRLACEELGKAFLPRYVSYSRALNLAKISEWGSMLSGYKRPASLSTFVVKLFGLDHPPNLDLAHELSLRFPTKLEEGMRKTGRWYKSLDERKNVG